MALCRWFYLLTYLLYSNKELRRGKSSGVLFLKIEKEDAEVDRGVLRQTVLDISGANRNTWPV